MRNGIGIERNHNGEVYVGNHKNDMREGRGVYHFPDKLEGDFKIFIIYMGHWQNNLKHGAGSYIWRKYNKTVDEIYENCILTAFVGWFYEDNMDVGMFYEETVKDLTLYYGKFKNNKKNDEQGFFYNNSEEETYVVICNIQDNTVLEGIKFVFKHDEETKLNKFLNFIEFKYGDETHENLREGSAINNMDKEIKDNFELAQKFIDILFKKEDFHNIYSTSLS